MSCAASTGCLARDALYPPDDAEVRDGVAWVRRENPALRGAVLLRVQEVRGPDGPFLRRKIMAPDAAYLVASPPEVMRDLGGLWSDIEPEDIPLGSLPIHAPAISLPMGGAPAHITMRIGRGRERTTPAPPGSIPEPIGISDSTIGTITVALEPRVIVLPVRLHQFRRRGSTGGATLNDRTASQLLDPGEVATIHLNRHNGPYSSHVEAFVGLFRPEENHPDEIWGQCDIQFHLDAFEEIFQTNEREVTLTEDCVCNRGLIGPTSRLTPFLEGRSGAHAFDVFIGGSISGTGCPPNAVGITCGPANSGLGGSCEDRVGGHRANVILARSSNLGNGSRLLAHEFGHMLGLGHILADDQPSCVTPDDTMMEPAMNLMSTGAVGSRLTAQQCRRARCIAARWLVHFGRQTETWADGVCSQSP
jgi:hypothetical protein